MRISTKGRYGLRAMIDLAENYTNGTPVFLSDIARRQEVSEKYLEHIFSALNKGRIVKAQRGRKGGYLLSRAPDQITIYDIITVLEGPCTIVDCVGDNSVCDRTKVCITREIWSTLGAAMQGILSGYTLASLVEMQKLRSEPASIMYYI